MSTNDDDLRRQIEELHQQIEWLIGERVSRIKGDSFMRTIHAAKWEMLAWPKNMRR